MNNIVNCNFKIDKELKQEFDKLCTFLGLTMSSAINMFVRQSVVTRGLPLNLNYNADIKIREDIERRIMNTEILCQKYPGDLTDEQIIKG
jgi:addiction module RelB/DinJ family antitoxin